MACLAAACVDTLVAVDTGSVNARVVAEFINSTQKLEKELLNQGIGTKPSCPNLYSVLPYRRVSGDSANTPASRLSFPVLPQYSASDVVLPRSDRPNFGIADFQTLLELFLNSSARRFRDTSTIPPDLRVNQYGQQIILLTNTGFDQINPSSSVVSVLNQLDVVLQLFTNDDLLYYRRELFGVSRYNTRSYSITAPSISGTFDSLQFRLDNISAISGGTQLNFGNIQLALETDGSVWRVAGEESAGPQSSSLAFAFVDIAAKLQQV